jgi:hypothetical protein
VLDIRAATRQAAPTTPSEGLDGVVAVGHSARTPPELNVV